jgi:hypothetical protein
MVSGERGPMSVEATGYTSSIIGVSSFNQSFAGVKQTIDQPP